MKNIKNILGVVVVLLAMTTLYSCKDEAPVYDPAEKVNTDQVYFPASNSASIKASSLANSFDVAIARIKSESAATVPLTLTGGDGLYTIPATVTFNPGQKETTFKVSYDPQVVGFDHFSDLVINIGEAFVTPYGLSEYAFNVGIPAPWKSLGKAKYVDDFFTALFGTGNPMYEVEIQENELQPGLFRLVNPYGAAYPHNAPGDWDDSRDWFLEINASDPEGVYMSVQKTGVDWGYGMISVGSIAGLYISRGETLAVQKEKGRTGTFENGIITFPAKSLLFSMANYNNGGLYTANGGGAFMVVMPGVVLADYSIEVTYLGRFTDTEEANFVVADVALGADVESAKVALVAGAPTNAMVAGIIDGSIESIEIEESGEVKFPNEVDGKFTVMAVSYGAGEAKEIGYDTFDFSVGSADPVVPVRQKIKSLRAPINEEPLSFSW